MIGVLHKMIIVGFCVRYIMLYLFIYFWLPRLPLCKTYLTSSCMSRMPINNSYSCSLTNYPKIENERSEYRCFVIYNIWKEKQHLLLITCVTLGVSLNSGKKIVIRISNIYKDFTSNRISLSSSEYQQEAHDSALFMEK